SRNYLWGGIDPIHDVPAQGPFQWPRRQAASCCTRCPGGGWHGASRPREQIMTAPDSLLSLQGLTVQFGGLTAIKDLSFEVKRGSVHALIGPNGAGKSTTFNCISRYYDPTRGSVRYDGIDITDRRADEMAALGVARTFQNLE